MRVQAPCASVHGTHVSMLKTMSISMNKLKAGVALMIQLRGFYNVKHNELCFLFGSIPILDKAMNLEIDMKKTLFWDLEDNFKIFPFSPSIFLFKSQPHNS